MKPLLAHWRFIAAPAVLLALAAPGFASRVAAQVRTVTVAGVPTCTSCRIELRRVVLLIEPASSPGLLGDSPVVARDSRGNWYVAAGQPRSTIAVFDRAGRLTGTFGRTGDGPGEFRSIGTMIFSPGDTLYVYETSKFRRTVFGPNHSLVRIEEIPLRPFHVAGLPDGRHVILGTIATTSTTKHSLTILTRAGAFAKSMLPFTAAPGANAPQLRGVFVDGAGRIWSSRFASYGADVLSPAGEKIEEYIVNSRWWNDAAHPQSEFRAAGPTPGDSSVIWFRSMFRDTSFHAPRRVAGDLTPPSADRIESTYDSMFEAVDRQSGMMLASARFPVAAPPGWGMLIPILRVLNDGTVAIEILEPVLLRRNP